MRMRRHHADTKSVGSAFGGRDRSLIDVAAVAVLIALGQNRNARILDAPVFRFAVIRFHANVLRIDRSEMNSRPNLKGFAYRNIWSVLISNLHVVNAHLRPGFSDSRFPLAELVRGGAFVAPEIRVRTG